ncbi:hypothetical protein CI784_08645 [Arthrobacter agilis]|nr:hypothetical protein CI784_08645 [Arthrobacter agilis]
MDSLAAEARKVGLKWSTARVGDLERGKLSPTLPMLLALCLALGRATGQELRLANLVDIDGQIEVNEKLTAPGGELQGVLKGKSVRFWDRTLSAVGEAAEALPGSVHALRDAFEWERFGLGDERAARKLGLTKEEMFRRSAALWGHNLSTERDKRSGTDASAQKRGQVTRALLDELRRAADGDS